MTTADTVNTGAADWIAKARNVLDMECAGIAAMSARLDASFAEALRLMAECRGRVVITGIGKSGLVGRKIAATLSSTGTPSFFLHPVEGAHGDLGVIRPEDVIIAISNSGETAELLAVLPVLKSLGTALIAMTGGAHSSMAQCSDVVLDTGVAHEACPLGLAPTTSTTATLAMGDALAACLIDWKAFTPDDFKRYHPGGALGKRLGLKVESLMHSEAMPVVAPDASLGAALKVLDAGRLGSVLIAENDKLAGILTDGDIRRITCRDGGLNLARPVSAYMVPSPRAAKLGQSVAELIDIMEEKEITVLPVVGEGATLVGVIHLHDLLGKGRVSYAK